MVTSNYTSCKILSLTGYSPGAWSLRGNFHLEPEKSPKRQYFYNVHYLMSPLLYTIFSQIQVPGSREHVIARCLPGMYKIRMLLTRYIITYVWHKSKAWIDLCSFGAEMSLQLNFHIRQISSLFLAHLRADGCIPVRTPPVLGTSQTAAVVACILRTSAVLW